MNSLDDIKSVLSQHKDELLKRYPIKKLAIFGSFAGNKQRDDSDIDILVEFDRSIGIEFIDLADEIESLFGTNVDLVSKNGIKKSYYDNIKNDLIYV